MATNNLYVGKRERRYAVYFYETMGYYLANHLSSNGTTSVMMLVCTPDEYHDVCVRKLHDLKVVRPEFNNVQCDEVRNQVMDHDCIPPIYAWSDYRQRCPGEVIDEYGNSRVKVFEYVTTATTWKFCNAGTMGTYVDAWYDHYSMDRFPEAFVWEYIYRIGTAVLDVQKKHGLVHRDLHNWNVVLDWPDTATFPLPYLIDFGQAIKFPAVQDSKFQTAFDDALWHDQGNRLFNSRGRVVSDILSREDKDSLDNWYGAAAQDVEDFALLIQDVILHHRPSHYQTAADYDQFAGTYFNTAAQKGDGVKGYSYLLTQAFANLINMIRTTSNPYQLHYDLRDFITNHVDPHRTPSKAAFDADPDEIAALEAWVRPRCLPAQMPPLTWKDLGSICRLTSDDNIRYSAHDAGKGRARGEDVFAAYREGDWDMDKPLVEIIHPDLDEKIFLRTDTFLIAEGWWYEETQKFEFLNYVEVLQNLSTIVGDESFDSSTLSHLNESLGNIDNGIGHVDEMDIADEEDNDGDADASFLYSIPQHVPSPNEPPSSDYGTDTR